VALALAAVACGGEDDDPAAGVEATTTSVPAAVESPTSVESQDGAASTDGETAPEPTDPASGETAPAGEDESPASESTGDASSGDDSSGGDSSDGDSSGDDSSDGDSTTGSAPPDGALEPGTAVVELAGDRFEFVVIQCVRDQPSPLTGDVIEFQLDGVPAATPPELVERLLGVIEADADVLAEIEPVVEFGPILSVTRLAAGGDLVAVTDLASIEAVSDPDPTTTRFAEIGAGTTGATVSASTTADGRPMTVAAVCP
jgi:hypothetical protein